MNLFKEFFAWWDGATWGTRLLLWRQGERVGTDAQGNQYYRQKNGDRRWVIYDGFADASRVPPEWHAWLHFTVPAPPSEAPLPTQPWEKEHVPNLTGTPYAYRPPGSLLGSGDRRPPSRPYEAWRPEE
jgi:NADH:ubiquinone oxidoreductase subunit